MDVAQWPLSGLKDAKYVFVELFDYNCPSCRKTHATITGAKKRLGDQLAVICLPVPMNSTCNPTVRVTNENNKESCDLANLAVAVWRVDETRFASFHDWMFQGAQAPSYAAAKARAAKLVGTKQLDAELASGIPERYVARHVEYLQESGSRDDPKADVSPNERCGRVFVCRRISRLDPPRSRLKQKRGTGFVFSRQFRILHNARGCIDRWRMSFSNSQRLFPPAAVQASKFCSPTDEAGVVLAACEQLSS